MNTGVIIQWDHKAQPDWDAVNAALREFHRPVIFEVDSGSDKFAIVIMADGGDEDEAQKYFDEHQFDA